MDFFSSPSSNSHSNKKLRIRIGPSVDSLTTATVNNPSNPHFIDSPYFTGHVVVRIKNFQSLSSSDNESTDYFNNRKRLFSIQVKGRFKHEYSSDDVVFGSEFERKISPPTGAWVAIKFANLIDPALLTDLYSDTPWLYSPILCSMNVVNVVVATSPISSPIPPNPTSANGITINAPNINLQDRKSIESSNQTSSTTVNSKKLLSINELGKWDSNELNEDTTFLFSSSSTTPAVAFPSDSIQGRRKYFQNQKARKSTIFTPDNIYNFEIFAPFMDYNTFDLSLGLNVNVVKYCENQPIRLMSKSLSLNIPFFVIEYDLVDDEKIKTDLQVEMEHQTSDQGEDNFQDANE